MILNGITKKHSKSPLGINMPLTTDLSGRAKGFSLTRSSVKWVPDFEGIYRSVPVDTPPFVGLRYATNQLYNSTTAGAVVGTPGTMPNGWGGGLYGLTRSIQAINSDGTIDIRLYGTTNVSYGSYLSFANGSATTNAYTVFVSQGQQWRMSLSLAVIGTPVGVSTLQTSLGTYTGTSGTGITYSTRTIYPTETLNRFTSSVLTCPSTTAIIMPYLQINAPINTYVDITLRIGMPQLEMISGQSNTNPSEYIQTTAGPVTQKFTYYNPCTADSNGLVSVNSNPSPIPYSVLKGVLIDAPSTNKCTCFGAIPYDSLSAEKVVNGSFSSDTSWNKAAGTTISSGFMNLNTATATDNYQTLAAGSLVAGRVYEVSYTVSSYTSGSVYILFGTTHQLTSRSANGAYVERVTFSGSSQNVNVRTGAAGFVGSVDNLSVKEVMYGIGTKTTVTGTINHTNMTVAGDAAGYLATVDGSSVIPSALWGLCPTGKVYLADNTAGTTDFFVTFGGVAGNVNAHTRSLWAKVTGVGCQCYVTNDASSTLVVPVSTTMQRYSKDGYVSTQSNGSMQLGIKPGASMYFILPQYEELVVATSPIPTYGATNSRAAETVKFPAINVASGNDLTFAWEMNFTALNGAGYPGILRMSADSPNYLGATINPADNKLYIERVVGGSVTAGNRGGSSLLVGTIYKCCARFSSTYGVDLWVNGSKISSNSTANAKVNSLVGFIDFTPNVSSAPRYLKNIKFYNKSLSDAQCTALTT